MFVIPGVKSPPILVWKVRTHNNLFITFSKSGPVLESLHLFLLPLFSCGFGLLKRGTWNTLLETLLCKLAADKSHQRMKMRCQRSYNHITWSLCCFSAVVLRGRPGAEARGQKSTADQPPPSASLLWGWNCIIPKRETGMDLRKVETIDALLQEFSEHLCPGFSDSWQPSRALFQLGFLSEKGKRGDSLWPLTLCTKI